MGAEAELNIIFNKFILIILNSLFKIIFIIQDGCNLICVELLMTRYRLI